MNTRRIVIAGGSGFLGNLIARRLSARGETVRILALPEVRKRFAELGSEVIGNSPGEFSAVIKAEIPQWAKLIKETGIRASD